MPSPLKAPYPWFGGKSRVAGMVWDRLERDLDNYIEPFFGSGAVLLARPDPRGVETVNDLDCMVANFWRATSRDPEAVVAYADGPVNECDLHSRHKWLVLSDDARTFRRSMRDDPEYYDAKVAGWWCWGLCCWIGGQWCAHVERPWQPRPLIATPGTEHGRGINGDTGSGPQRRPLLAGDNPGSTGKGIHAGGGLSAQSPSLTGEAGASGRGIHASGGPASWHQLPKMDTGTGGGMDAPPALPEGRPQLADAHDIGRGVNSTPPEGWTPHQRRPYVSGGDHQYGVGIHAGSPADLAQRLPLLRGNYGMTGDGVNMQAGAGLGPPDGTCAVRRAWLLDWLGRLRDRLRNVRVCCGNWGRVVASESVTTRLGTTGVFLDPPYAKSVERMAAWLAHLRGEGPPPDKGRASNRADGLYATDHADVDRLVAQVHLWAVQSGSDPRMRIVLAGYEGEHDPLESLGWRVEHWHAQGGYGNRSKRGKANARRERLWFSPHCVYERGLFDAA